MARINLLPWREEQRRERQRQFMSSLLLTAILGVVLVFFAGFVFDQKIAHQQARNALVQKEIKALEAEIGRLKASLSDPGLYGREPVKFEAIAKALAEKEAELAGKEERWLELEILREAIERVPR